MIIDMEHISTFGERSEAMSCKPVLNDRLVPYAGRPLRVETYEPLPGEDGWYQRVFEMIPSGEKEYTGEFVHITQLARKR